MILDLNYQHHDYIQDILPFTKNGIFIDTSIILIMVEGLISTRIRKKKDEEYNVLLRFLDLIKVNNEWSKFFITAHVLSEVCGYINRNHNKDTKYKEICSEILPILSGMGEKMIQKKRILNFIDSNKPVIEIGDISIFLATEDLVSLSQKASILAKDNGFNNKYKNDQSVLVMDFHSILLNSY